MNTADSQRVAPFIRNEQMAEKSNEEIRRHVMEDYAEVARAGEGCCDTGSGCCATPAMQSTTVGELLGYSRDELGALPEGANMGLGCGNPQQIARLKPGERVMDLGSGAGIDCFLAARQVGPAGKVVGVDMTSEMVARATAFAREGGFENVEFRLGEIEEIPVADNSIDVILSNCVINLSPDKQAVFNEAFRVLDSGGRLALSDIVATTEIPEEIRNDRKAFSGCISGAALVTDVENMLRNAGFENITIDVNEASRAFIADWSPGSGVENYVASASIEATKP